MPAERDDKKYAYLLFYERRGGITWIAHLDLMRTVERAVHRAGLPVVWSQGYNPRPAIEFALPVGVGIETRRDPFSLVLSEAMASDAIEAKLNEVLPAGLRIVEAKDYEPDKKSLMARVEAATYEFVGDGVEMLFAPLSSGSPLVVEKHSKKGRREIDIRPRIRSFELNAADRLTVCVNAGSRDNIRPDLLLTALSAELSEPFEWQALTVIRRAVVLN